MGIVALMMWPPYPVDTVADESGEDLQNEQDKFGFAAENAEMRRKKDKFFCSWFQRISAISAAD
jgi:hypothetical protein